MTVLTVCLALQGGLPVWLATLILGRDVALGIAAIYYRYASLPHPKTFTRFWDFSLPSAEVHPTGVSKINTFLQLCLIGATTASPLVAPTVQQVLGELSAGIGVNELMGAAQYLVAGTTVWSGASYLYTRNAVKILGAGLSDHEKRKILSRGRGVLAASFACFLGVAVSLEQ